MLDIGWSEMAVIALVALVVIGPKDLPKAMKTVAFWVRKARKLASEFHSGIDQLVREAELEEAREAIRSAGQMNLDRAVEQTIDPTGEVNKALSPAELADLPGPTSAEPADERPALAPAASPAAPAAAPPTPEPVKAEPEKAEPA
ncbi:MAG TPA: Sec-independent protein translocase protein TatB [Alphaproteobacteria bacterium]